MASLMSQAPVVAAVITAAVVFLVGFLTVMQKWRSDARQAWWTRAQWAIDKSLSPNPDEREVGSESMGVLVNAHFGVPNADIRVLEVALLRAMVDRREVQRGA